MISSAFFILCSIQAIFAFTPISPSHSPNKINDSAAPTTTTVEIDSRRAFLNTAVAGLTPLIISSWNPQITNALETSPISDQQQQQQLTLFKDTNVGFEIQVPTKWQQSEQTLPDRRKILLFMNNGNDEENKPAQGSEDLIFVAYTSVRDDFTSLGSFGTVDQVGQATILPKGRLAGQETENEMISSESKKNAYYFDYTSKTPDQPKRHFRTIFTLIQGATGGAGSVLVTVTAQTLESRYDDGMKKLFDEIIDSYRKV